MCSPEEIANMTDKDPAGSALPEQEHARSPRPEPGPSQPAEDPGYLTETGQAVGDDGSVVPIIGGLPAVEGSAWDIGAPLEDRGAGLADEPDSTSDRPAGQQEGNDHG
jgi:hypothetical protein